MENISGLFAGTAVVAVFGFIASMWRQIKAAFQRFMNIFIETIHLDETNSNAIVLYLLSHYKHGRAYQKSFECYGIYNKEKNEFESVALENLTKTSLSFYNKFYLPIAYHCKADKKQNDISTNGSTTAKKTTEENASDEYGYGVGDNTYPCRISFLKGTVNVKKLFSNAIREFNELTQKNAAQDSIQSFYIMSYSPANNVGSYLKYQGGIPSNAFGSLLEQPTYRLISHSKEILDRADRFNINYLYFPEEVDKHIQEIKIWRNNKKWYNSKRIPWKAGWIMYGPPGSGKTVLTRAIGETLGIPIFIFNLNGMTNAKFDKFWQEMTTTTSSNIPKIVLFEDFDNVFHGRENVNKKDNITVNSLTGKKTKQSDTGNPFDTHLTFDNFLNKLDGVDKAEGMFYVITTNDVSKIDQALAKIDIKPDGTKEIYTRPGRIDKVIELGYMSLENKYRMAHHIFNDLPEGRIEIEEYLTKQGNKVETPAQFQTRCAEIALQCLFNRSKDDTITVK